MHSSDGAVAWSTQTMSFVYNLNYELVNHEMGHQVVWR
jgi:hypothetical protein